MSAFPGRVLVMGAGAIGCYLGGRLAAAGADVHFVGRPRVLAELRAHGLTVLESDGSRASVPAGALRLHEFVPAGLPVALVLLCVKSGATAEAASELAASLAPGTLVASMQNGLHNAELAAQAAPSLQVCAGMVPYNVAAVAPGTWLRGSSGALALEDDPALRAWLPALRAAGLAAATHADMRAVQWAKLLLNLNNPVNALSGRPLRAQLLDADLRRVTAALMSEAAALLRVARQPLARLTPLPAAALPALMRLPTPLFRLVAARLLRIDPRARSSMADDLALGRRTEIAALCGEVVRLAGSLGRDAPRNARMVTLVEAAESGTLAVPCEPGELRRTIESAR
ncbi:MAG: 2-dehydropantoate 2-reductase [Burkholderiaceae bacterium]